MNVIKYLVETKIYPNINIIDRWGGTPYDDAVREGFNEVRDYLKSKGG